VAAAVDIRDDVQCPVSGIERGVVWGAKDICALWQLGVKVTINFAKCRASKRLIANTLRGVQKAACLNEYSRPNPSKMPSYNGSCLCGGVKFTISADPVILLSCFCEHCSKGAGGPNQLVSRSAAR
jgi:hypothetical protein